MLSGESGCFEEVFLTRSRVMLQSGIASRCQKHLDFVEPGTPWPDTDDEVTWPGSHDCGPPRQCPLEKSQMVIPWKQAHSKRWDTMIAGDSRIWEDLMLRYRNPAFAGNYGEEREEREEFRERAFEGSLLNGLRLPGLLLTLQVAMKTHQSRIRYVWT